MYSCCRRLSAFWTTHLNVFKRVLWRSAIDVPLLVVQRIFQAGPQIWFEVRNIWKPAAFCLKRNCNHPLFQTRSFNTGALLQLLLLQHISVNLPCRFRFSKWCTASLLYSCFVIFSPYEWLLELCVVQLSQHDANTVPRPSQQRRILYNPA